MKKFKIWYKDASQVFKSTVIPAFCEEMALLIFSNSHTTYEIKLVEEI